MDKDNLTEELFAEIRKYINIKLDLTTLSFTKKIGKIVSKLILLIIISVLLLFFTVFISYSFIQWYSTYVGEPFVASLIVSAFYLVLIFIILIFRKKMIYLPIQKAINSGITLTENNKIGDVKIIKSNKDIDKKIEKLLEEDFKTEEEIKNIVSKIKYYYSYEGIKERVFGSVLKNPTTIISSVGQIVKIINSFIKHKKQKKESNTEK